MQMVALHLDAKFVVLVCVELMATDMLTDRKAQPKGDVKSGHGEDSFIISRD
jgi:hypothetical protein